VQKKVYDVEGCEQVVKGIKLGKFWGGVSSCTVAVTHNGIWDSLGQIIGKNTI